MTTAKRPASRAGEKSTTPGDGTGTAAFGGRAIWGIADQGIFSATSFALAIGIAHHATAAQFGAFGLAYVAYTLVLGAVEAFTAEVVVVRGSHLDTTPRHSLLGSAAGTAFVCGLCCSVIATVFVAFAHGTAPAVVAPLFLPAPLLFLQDLWRFGFFASGRPSSAALNDLLWGILFGAAFAAVSDSTHITWIGLAWCWSGAGAVCGLAGAMQSRCLPRPATVLTWIRQQSRAGGRFAGEYLALYGAGQSILIWVGVFAGLAESGGYRGAAILFGPVQVAMNAVRLAITPMVVRAHHAGKPRAAWRGGIGVAVCAATLALIWGVALLLLSDSIGEHLLGHAWSATRPVLPMMLWLSVVQGCALGAVVVLRVVAAYRQTFRIRLASASLIVVLGGAGASHSAVTACAGAALAVTLTAGFLWRHAHRIAAHAASPSPNSDVRTPHQLGDGAGVRSAP